MADTRKAVTKLVRTDTFDKAYHGLDGTVQKHAIDHLHRLQLDPNSNGLNLKQPNGARDPRVWTARVTDNFRSVLMRDGEAWYLVTILPHDKAYKYAERVTFDINTVTGAIELLDLGGLEDVLEATGSGRRSTAPGTPAPRGLFDHVSDGEFSKLGVNSMLIPALRELHSEDALLGICEFLPKLTRDVVLSLADGQLSTDRVWEEIVAPAQADTPVDPHDFEAAQQRPATQETFVVSADAEELERSLLRPMSEWRIFLHPTQRALAYRAKPYAGPVRITGGPGTGKTVVALHRVAHLAERYESDGRQRILLTTFTTTLARQLEALLRDLGGPDLLAKVKILNIDKVAMALAGLPAGTALLGDDKLRTRWEIVAAESSHGKWDAKFLAGEWTQVVLAQGIETRDEYFAARRTGRGRRVSRADRAEIWALIEQFQRALQDDKVVGFKQLAADAARAAEHGLDSRHNYDHIVVDEAQDLHAAHWRLLRALVPHGPDDLFIVGDTHQRIYDNKVTLGSLGIDIRGRSKKLTLNYRTTREILAMAGQILNGEEYDDLDGGPEDLAGYRSVLLGPDAELAGYRTVQDELAALAERVHGWRDAGISGADIVVVARTTALADRAAAALDHAGIAAVRVDPGKSAPSGDQLHVMTMHRVKGLEYRAVAVIAVDNQHVPLPTALADRTSDPAQYAQDLRAERSLLFVAATRARETLAVTWSGTASSFLPVQEAAQS